MNFCPTNHKILKCFSISTSELGFFLDIVNSGALRTFQNFIACILKVSRSHKNGVTEVISLHTS
jgi:hypothetical protein